MANFTAVCTLMGKDNHACFRFASARARGCNALVRIRLEIDEPRTGTLCRFVHGAVTGTFPPLVTVVRGDIPVALSEVR